MDSVEVQTLLELLNLSSGGFDDHHKRSKHRETRERESRRFREFHHVDQYYREEDEDDSDDRSSQSTSSVDERERVVSQLMSVALQCLGAIRLITVEQEKLRVVRDCVDIDGSERVSGTASRLQRQLFSQAATTLLDSIMIGRELHAKDPVKELIESFPSTAVAPSLSSSRAAERPRTVSPQWFMCHWAIMQDFLTPPRAMVTSSEGRAEMLLAAKDAPSGVVERESDHREEVALVSENTLSLVKATLRHFPQSLTEVDCHGQTYIVYALRTQSVALLELLLRFHSQIVFQEDAHGRLAIHYAATHSETMEPLLVLSECMGRSLDDLARNCVDRHQNLLVHFAASGSSSLGVLEELLFCYPDCVKVPNADGQFPLHIAAQHCENVAKVKAIFRAYPNAISAVDNNGWLPLQLAAYSSRSLEVVKFIYECYPDAIKKVNRSGRIPLHYNAVKCMSPKIMKFLLDAYPDSARIFDVNRRLALHNLIARCEHWTPARLKCLRMLLDAFPEGASLADKDRRTPYDLARRDEHGPLVLRLLLLADPAQDPLALGELTYFASKAKYKDSEDHK